MRKVQKQEVLEFIQSLYQAHEEIKEALNQNNRISAQNMLAECQEFATSLGESIEGLEGEGHATVTCIEGYCETLFHAYEELNSDRYNETKIYKKLKKQLLKIENSAKNDITVRKEVVFLPYKASMWDSLESVWKAADEDEYCDAYVVPIPYYDKNSDGSFREIHYEGNQYPDYVPITSYEDYDFKTRKPDTIYIHNPYDNMNLVTSVHPFFFSDNLKKFTDKLVYIPYFILGEIKPDEDEKIEGMKHFCTVPGVFNADKVIVQSEDMKQVYIKVLLNETNNHTEAARAYWEEKILGIGSPKIDKVVNTRKEGLDIPQEWLKVIQKSDGSWKKIILYNTSIGAFLQNGEQMLKKIEDVFNVFKENKEDMVLLWRPHPLMKATVESMRPQLWAEYCKIVFNFKKEDWGIYDESDDIDRAIVISDAYYGDGSSVVEMYHLINKTAIIQNIYVIYSLLEQKNEVCLNFRDCFRIKNKLYFSNIEFNGLFEISLESFKVKLIHVFSNMDANQFFGVGQYNMKYNNRIIFLVNDTKQKQLCCYNLLSDEENIIDFPGDIEDSMIYCYTFVKNNKGYFFPSNLSLGVHVIDLDTFHICKDEALSILLKSYKWGMRCTKQDEQTFSFLNANKNEIVFVNVETKKKRLLGVPIKGVNGFTINKKIIWMMQADSTDVYEWNIMDNSITKFVLEKYILWDKKDVPYSDLIYVKEQDCIFLVGNSIGYILKTNRYNKTIEIAFDFPKGFKFCNNKLMYYSYFAEVERINDELWFYPIRSNMILVYDIHNNIVKGIKSTIDLKDIPQYQKIVQQELREYNCWEYEGIYSLQNIINLIKEEN